MSIHFDNPAPCCPKCRHKGFKGLPYDKEKTRIHFQCGHCYHVWSSGNRGGEYLHRCTNLNYSLKINEIYWKERQEYERENRDSDLRKERVTS